MEINNQILESVLKNYAKSDKELYSSLENVTEEEFKNKLQELNLSEYTKRDSFFWELQILVEKCVIEQGGSDDNERLAEMVVNAWNNTSEPKITQSLALSFIYLINLKFPNTRKSFNSICEGDLQSYKTFNSKSRLFTDLLIRFLTCIFDKQQYNVLLHSVEQAMLLLFEGTSKSDYWDSLNRLGFRNKKGLNFGKMNAYKRDIGLNGLVYAEGIKSILLNVLSETQDSELLISLKNKVTSHAEIEELDDSEDEIVVDDLLDTYTPEVNSPVALVRKEEEEHFIGEANHVASKVGTLPSVDEQSKTLENEVLVDDTDESGVQKETSNLTEEPKSEIVSVLEKAFATVQSALDIASKLPVVENLTKEVLSQENSNQHRLKIAGEEIDRLKIALQQEKEKVALAEEKAYAKVLNAIGGESSNYLLSDLFEESQGKTPNNPNISAGRLINLFSSLSLAIGLEEFTNNYEIGDIFSVQKDELIREYRIDGPIDTQCDAVKVKLLKYGWTINNKVVIQPLVTEVKEEL
ncbi:hypothetical protein [Lysinibacillus boronitolerans]|uniref:hypothetical protein n=1 Tax=Lysinibacillus boronitolerans TaxID=309788 RepID=UPI003851B466